MSDKISDKEKAFYGLLLEMFDTADYITSKMITEKSDIPVSTARRYLAKMCEWKIIYPDGKTKATKYYLL